VRIVYGDTGWTHPLHALSAATHLATDVLKRNSTRRMPTLLFDRKGPIAGPGAGRVSAWTLQLLEALLGEPYAPPSLPWCGRAVVIRGDSHLDTAAFVESKNRAKALGHIRRRVLERCGILSPHAQPPRPERVISFWSRRSDAKWRVLSNDAELAAGIASEVSKHNEGWRFEHVHFEDHNNSMCAQAKIAFGAAIIVLVHGGSVSNLLFARSPAAILELFPPGHGHSIGGDLSWTRKLEYSRLGAPADPKRACVPPAGQKKWKQHQFCKDFRSHVPAFEADVPVAVGWLRKHVDAFDIRSRAGVPPRDKP